MKVQAALSPQVVFDCSQASREAAEARQSDWAVLVGCLANPSDDNLVELQEQADRFLALSERLANWHELMSDDKQSLSTADKRHLLDDLRQALVAIRVAAFDVGLHGRGAGMTDCEITEELVKHARLDCQLRAYILPPLKEELGVTDTVAL